MVINALLPNLPPDGNGVNKNSGMDCMNNEEQNASIAGFCLQNTEKQIIADFSELYAKVALSNEAASVETENNLDIESKEYPEFSEFLTECNTLNDGLLPPELLLYTMNPEYNDGIGINSENISIASGLIRDALATISDVLDLSASAPEQFCLTRVTEGTVDQCAEIIHVLKQIVAALDSSASGGMIPDFGKGELDPESAGELSSKLLIEQFKLEMGMQLLGISTQVQDAVAQKAEQLFTTGINQAVNPATVVMPVEQMKKLFGDMINSSENMGKAGTSEVLVNGSEVENVNTNKQSSSVRGFDTLTYRALLKVDRNDKGSDQKSAERLNDISAAAEDVLSAAVLQSGNTATDVSGTDIAVFPQGNQAKDVSSLSAMSNVAESFTKNVPKTIDESQIMGQIADKLHAITRSGVSEVRIHLRPETLGEVKLLIRVEGDIVAAQIHVESQQVRHIVESNLQALKDALAQQNLHATSIEVSVGKEGLDRNNQEWQNQRFQNGNSNSQKAMDMDQTDTDSHNRNRQFMGTETGKRYGSNSIEYFA